MDLVKSIYPINWGALFLLLTFVACAENEAPAEEPLLEETDGLICWDVQSYAIPQSKALVDSDVLQTACGSGGESIGIWGEYTMTTDEGTSTTTVFDATPLTYGKKNDETTNNPYNDWNYPGKPKFWKMGATYLFKFCFPQARMMNLMTDVTPEVIQGPVNTSEIQEDLLVASAYVDTNTANLAQPVPLKMQHIFAAIRFKVKAVEGFTPATGEGVTSCWLQNKTNDNNLFSPAGYLVHSGNAEPVITWHTYESSSAPMYKWEHNGVSFESENTLYTPNEGKTGEEYTHNDGWVLVVPQTVKAETLQFCYTLKNAGNQVVSVNIPPVTYEHGKQYTYVLEIRGSEADISLTVKPWNHLDSSYDITL